MHDNVSKIKFISSKNFRFHFLIKDLTEFVKYIKHRINFKNLNIKLSIFINIFIVKT